MKRFQITELDSKEKLQNLYLNKKLSTYEIASLFNVSRSVIRRRIKEFRIQVRSIGEATHLQRTNHVELNFEAFSFLVGELLGDGHLRSNNQFSAQFMYSSQYKQYCVWISEILTGFGIKQSGKIITKSHPSRNSIGYQYSSKVYAELKPIHEMFYSDKIKFVPSSLKLNPLIVRQWFIGDGSLNFPLYAKNAKPAIRFATDGFEKNDVEFLVFKLQELGFFAQRDSCHNQIAMSVFSTSKFLAYIGKCPQEIVNIYGYKFNYPKIDPNQLKLDI